MKNIVRISILAICALSQQALTQGTVPEESHQHAHDQVMDSASPEMLAEVERIKKAHQDRAAAATRSPELSPEAQDQGLVLSPTAPEPIVIIAVETADGGMVATEL